MHGEDANRRDCERAEIIRITTPSCECGTIILKADERECYRVYRCRAYGWECINDLLKRILISIVVLIRIRKKIKEALFFSRHTAFRLIQMIDGEEGKTIFCCIRDRTLRYTFILWLREWLSRLP